MKIVPLNIVIREARENEAEKLSDIAIRSKAHWGYPAEWIEAWRPDLKITPDYIRKHHVRSVLIGGQLVGFYALKLEDEKYLDHLWLLPEAIGQGVGRLAFAHAVELARQLEIGSFLIISDVHAEGFYLKMNARRIGEFFSQHQSRMIPKLLFQIPSDPGGSLGAAK